MVTYGTRIYLPTGTVRYFAEISLLRQATTGYCTNTVPIAVLPGITVPVATKRDTFLSGQNPNSVNILSVSLAIRYCILKCKLFEKNRERFDPCTGPEVYKSLGSLP